MYFFPVAYLKEGGQHLNHRNRKKIVIIFIILAIAMSVICEESRYFKYGVKKAVFKPWAYHVQDGDHIFVVGYLGKYDKGGTELYFYLDENGDKVQVKITGNSPFYAMDARIYKKNIYLVYGSINNEMSDYLGIDVIDAEEWDIIAPIKRTGGSKRFFSPKWYLDMTDVESGGYQNIDINTKGIYYWEEACIRHLWSGGFIIVTSEYINESIQWYMIKNGQNIPVTLKGNTPDQYYEDNAILEAEKDTFADKQTRFILKGELSENEMIFVVEEWRKIHWSNWYYNQLEY